MRVRHSEIFSDHTHPLYGEAALKMPPYGNQKGAKNTRSLAGTFKWLLITTITRRGTPTGPSDN